MACKIPGGGYWGLLGVAGRAVSDEEITATIPWLVAHTTYVLTLPYSRLLSPPVPVKRGGGATSIMADVLRQSGQQ